MILYPANVRIRGVLSVGASDRDNLQANHSPTANVESLFNQKINLVAPSNRANPDQNIAGEGYEVYTIDINGEPGYNPDKSNNPRRQGDAVPNEGINYLFYTGKFGGTSAKCPMVAGVAALLLSVNPKLTQARVYDILTSSADKIGGFNYENGRSVETSFGRLNAFRALQLAGH